MQSFIYLWPDPTFCNIRHKHHIQTSIQFKLLPKTINQPTTYMITTMWIKYVSKILAYIIILWFKKFMRVNVCRLYLVDLATKTKT